MTRKDLITSPEYWTTHIQLDLYESAVKFMQTTGKNRKELAEHLGVSKSYVTQLLNGNFDHRLSKLVELALAFGCIPKMEFVSTEKYAVWDAAQKNTWNSKEYAKSHEHLHIVVANNMDYISTENSLENKKVA